MFKTVEININAAAVFLMQAAAKANLLQYPPPPVLTPQLITAASVISTRLFFDLGVFIAGWLRRACRDTASRWIPAGST